MNRLNEKVAVITGANSGIGKTTAELFAQEGAAVVLVARRADKLKEVEENILKQGGRASAVPGDVGSVKDCEKVFEQTINTYDKVDIPVNHTGIVDQHTPTIKVTDELWQNVVNINQTGTFLFFREALRHMAKAGSGAWSFS